MGITRTAGGASAMLQQLARRGGDRPAPVAPSRGGSRHAWTLLALIVGLLAASLVIAFTGGERWDAKAAVIPVLLALAVVGALIAARTGNRLGWLFLATGATGAVGAFVGGYAARVPTAELPGAQWVGWVFPVILGLEQPLFFVIPLLFPDGRPPSPRWRPLIWVAIAAGLVNMVSVALSDADFSANFPWLRDPVTLVPPLGTAYNVSQEVGLVLFALSAVSMIVRFRRACPDERLQLKWFVYAAAVSAVGISVCSTFMANPLPAFDTFFPLIPAAVGVAILKYRLYDIDRLISRTLSYAIVTGLLVGVYAGLVLLATEVFRFHTPVAVAAATLAAAALFNPVRRRVQRIVDRRFNRVRYDADQTVAAFASSLRDAVDPGTVRADLLTVVSTAVEPAHVAVWIAGGHQA